MSNIAHVQALIDDLIAEERLIGHEYPYAVAYKEHLNSILNAKSKKDILITTHELDDYLRQGDKYFIKENKKADEIREFLFNFLLEKRREIIDKYDTKKLFIFLDQFVADKAKGFDLKRPLSHTEREMRNIVQQISNIIDTLSHPESIGLYEQSQYGTMKKEVSDEVSSLRKTVKKSAFYDYYNETVLLPFYKLVKEVVSNPLKNVKKFNNGGESSDSKDDFENTEKNPKFTHKIIKDEIYNILSGKSEIRYGAIIQAASSYLRRNESSGSLGSKSQSLKDKEAKELKKYAISNNLWITKVSGTQFAQGNEHDVYSYDKKTVIKTNNVYFYDSWIDYFNSLLLHNFFFPDTPYELIGFTDNNGYLLSVVKQPFVQISKTRPTDLDAVKKYLLDKGFVNTNDNDYENIDLGIRLGDLHAGNVLTQKGILYFIDTVFKLKTKLSDGGTLGSGNYQKRVSDNFQHMSTDSRDWKSTAIIGESKVEVNGKEKSMPVFDFPKGYKQAPTLFPSGTSEPYTCELCGKTPIKVVYWLQNDKQKWTLGVGSECVTHFEEGASGKDNVRQFKINRAIILDNDLINLSGIIADRYRKKRTGNYGKTEISWRGSFVGEGSGIESIEKAHQLVVNGELDSLFDLSPKNAYKGKNEINWIYVYKSIPVFGYDHEIKNKERYGKDQASVERELLSWYKRKEKESVRLIIEARKVLLASGSITESDFDPEYIKDIIVPESKMEEGGNIEESFASHYARFGGIFGSYF